MRVFVTGASGFIGVEVVKELVKAGHKVVGMARSDEGVKRVKNAGGEVHRGTLEDLESLKSGAATADGVIHLAFNHDFSKFQQNCEDDRKAIEAMGDALAGTNRPLIVTGGVALIAPDRIATEKDTGNANFPRHSERAGLAQIDKGVKASVMRLPQVHDPRKQGLVTYLVEAAKQTGVSAYVEEGSNHWPACHVTDCARLYRLALEKADAGDILHAVAEQGITLKEIAETLGKRLNLPVVSIPQEKVEQHFGWLAMFAGVDCRVSADITQKKFDWHPKGPKLITDLQNLVVEKQNALA
ncbi:MAG TPA: SDR family oxidoreductase [Planktothrix sp.]|jgi:nucleoside-diphosphate-sugar epimerase